MLNGFYFKFVGLSHSQVIIIIMNNMISCVENFFGKNLKQLRESRMIDNF